MIYNQSKSVYEIMINLDECIFYVAVYLLLYLVCMCVESCAQTKIMVN